MGNNYINYTWESERDKRVIFPVIVQCPQVHMENIHPLKQKTVQCIYKAFHDDDRVVAIVLFGSSVNMRCTIYSDSDFAVRLSDDCVNKTVKSDVSEIIQEICDWTADVLWYDELDKDSQLYDNVLKGVQIV